MVSFFKDNTVYLLISLLWVLPWKGYALWTAARTRNKKWFIALLLINTFAILDIFYIFYIAKKTKKDIKRIVDSMF